MVMRLRLMSDVFFGRPGFFCVFSIFVVPVLVYDRDILYEFYHIKIHRFVNNRFRCL